MNIAKALDHLWLIAADDHIDQRDASYMHPLTGPVGCETCFALDKTQKVIESLGKPDQVRLSEDIEAAIGVPSSIALEPLTLPLDIEGETFLGAEWDVDELQLSITRQAAGLELCVTGALELDGLIELRDKVINPAIAHHEAREQAEADQRERERAEHAARAEEREREQAERNRMQIFRGVSIRRTITENLTVHGRECGALTRSRESWSPGTIIFAYTAEDLTDRLPSAMSGSLRMRFCAKCKPIPNTQLHNSHLGGCAPLDEPMSALIGRIESDIWEAHHAALTKHDEENA